MIRWIVHIPIIINRLQEWKEGMLYDIWIINRFSDFDYLFQTLRSKYPGIIIAALPEKNPFTKLNIDKLNSEFLQNRLESLKIFLNQLIQHSELGYCSDLYYFLTDSNQQFEKKKQNQP